MELAHDLWRGLRRRDERASVEHDFDAAPPFDGAGLEAEPPGERLEETNAVSLVAGGLREPAARRATYRTRVIAGLQELDQQCRQLLVRAVALPPSRGARIRPVEKGGTART